VEIAGSSLDLGRSSRIKIEFRLDMRDQT